MCTLARRPCWDRCIALGIRLLEWQRATTSHDFVLTKKMFSANLRPVPKVSLLAQRNEYYIQMSKFKFFFLGSTLKCSTHLSGPRCLHLGSTKKVSFPNVLLVPKACLLRPDASSTKKPCFRLKIAFLRFRNWLPKKIQIKSYYLTACFL